MEHYEILIIGGGAAGMGACLAAEEKGCKSMLLVERSEQLGGVLNQCLHHGFGLGYFHENISGLEYASRFRARMESCSCKIMLNTMVTELTEDKTALLSGQGMLKRVSFDHCIMATGSRERSIYSLPVSGTRPAGVFTAGTAQRLVNLGGYDIGDQIVILGTGDIGQIMARRLSLHGKKILMMVELNERMGGLARNQKECVAAYHIPVRLKSTISRIYGKHRIEGVDVKNLDTGEVLYLPCDTLITAVGLIPERDLCNTWSRKPEWLHYCGNCDYIHPIVDSVTMQAEEVGKKIFD